MNGYDVPVAVLTHWYVCGRKIKHSTYNTAIMHAEAQNIAWGNYRKEHQINLRWPYECEFCGYWHMGRPPQPTKQLAPSRRRVQHHHNMVRAWNQQAYRDYEDVAPSKAELNQAQKRARGVACTPDEPVPPQATPAGVQPQSASPDQLLELAARFNVRS